MAITAKRLLEACGDQAGDAGIQIKTALEPLAGEGAPVKPAIYAGGLYQFDRRWIGDGAARAATDVVVIDNVPSQANRLEAALLGLRADLGLPELVLDLTGTPLPPHLPKAISSFRFPHRQADAYLRDAMLDGKPFLKTPIGQSLFAATADEPASLLQWFPQALLFGFWQSHLGKRSQAKLARSWVSEIVGVAPATTETKVLALKGDPLNLSVDEAVQFDEETAEWQFAEGSKKVGDGKKKEKLSEIGHGQVPVKVSDASPAAISFASISQTSSLSFPALRRIWFGSSSANAAGRSLLASIGLIAHAAAFGRAFTLRSGCDLVPTATTWSWLSDGQRDAVPPLTVEQAIEIYRGCVEEAERQGLPVGKAWTREPLQLTPNPELAKVIAKSWPEVE